MFSKACQYGIKAAVFIAASSKEGRRVNVAEVAAKTDSPVAFTSKVLQILSRNHIVESQKGPTGGFEISAGKAAVMKLSDIVTAIDGRQVYEGCALGFSECDKARPCPVHSQFSQVRNDLKRMLENTSLVQLSGDITNGLSFLTKNKKHHVKF